MKPLLCSLALLLCAALSPAFSQTATTGSGGLYNVGTVSSTGPLGLAVSYQAGIAPPSTHTFAWFNSGAVPVACTFEVDGSTDNIHWYPMTATGNDCTAPSMLHIADAPVEFIRVEIDSYTPAANGLDAVTFAYVRGVQ